MCGFFVCLSEQTYLRFGFTVSLLVSLKGYGTRIGRVVFPFSLPKTYIERTNKNLSSFSLLEFNFFTKKKTQRTLKKFNRKLIINKYLPTLRLLKIVYNLF